MTLGYSRRAYAEGFLHERMPALLSAHENAFAHFGGRCESLLYDRMRTVVLGSQVEADILKALDSGVLGGASLDVFEEEPLVCDSRFWTMPNVYVTPHVAASSDVKALFRHVEQQIARFESGQPLEHVVDKVAGY